MRVVPTTDPAGADRCGDRTAMMPLCVTTRAQNRAHSIATFPGTTTVPGNTFRTARL
jgi:hypothetical protein